MEGAVAVHPFHGPLSLLADHVDVLDGREQEVLLLLVLDVGVDQQRVGLRVHVLHSDLEAVEAPCLGHLHLRAELLSQILKHDAVRGREKGENILDEVLLVSVQLLPVTVVLVKVDLVCSPEGCQVFFVHLKDGVVLDRE